jgi:glycosyltransferase involved in cell wall biosynthesis
MNIVMVFSTKIPVCEGIGSHVLSLAKRLRSRGHDITLMIRGDHRGTKESEYEGFRVVKVCFYPLYPFHVHLHRLAVQKAIQNLGFIPDLVHLHSPLVPSLTKNWPMVTTFHSPMLTTTASLENVGFRASLIKLMGKTTSYHMEKKLLNNSEAIITVSYGVADELREHYDISPECLDPILNSIDTTFFQPGDANEGPRSLLFVGRLDYGKGLFDLIQSAGPVVQAWPEIRYIIVGGGPLENQLKKLVEESGLTNNFHFRGVIHDRQEILQCYQEAYAVLLPTHYEGMPMVMLEAMACGKPLITTKASFSKGVLENGSNALLVTPKAPEELAEACLRLLADQDLALKLGRKARATVIEQMDDEKNTEKVLQVYKLAMERFSVGQHIQDKL